MQVPYLPCVFLLRRPYPTVARGICISCRETARRAEGDDGETVNTVRGGMGAASCRKFPNPCHNLIKWEWAGTFRWWAGVGSGTEGRRKAAWREKNKRTDGCRCSTHCARPWLTWWLTHVYRCKLMTKAATYHNPFIGPLEWNGMRNFHSWFLPAA